MSDIELHNDIEEACNVLKPEIIKLKGLLQLWNIFTSAKTIADEFHTNHDSLSFPLKLACTKGLVVDYFKPWSGNYSDELNSLKVYTSRRNWTYPFLDPTIDNNIHHELEEIRNRMVAHIDQDFEGLGITVKGATISNKLEDGSRQPGTLKNVFLPATIMLSSNRGMWWLSDKDKLGAICNHINHAKLLVEDEIRRATSDFRNLCMDHMHVINDLSDIIGVEEQPFRDGKLAVGSYGELPKPFYASTPVSTKIGDDKIQSLVTVYEPKPLYPTNTSVEGKGYILKLGDFNDEGKLDMNVIFPKYPAPKVKSNET